MLTHPYHRVEAWQTQHCPPTPTCGWVFGYLHGRGATGLNLGVGVCEEGHPGTSPKCPWSSQTDQSGPLSSEGEALAHTPHPLVWRRGTHPTSGQVSP